MANWAKLQEDLTGLPVVKRARHGIHFDKGNGEIVANFSGAPCHFQDTDGLWKPIDTKLLLGNDGFYGCPHSPVKVHKDGRVKVDKSNYSQFTKLPGSPIGKVDGDRIVREFPGGYQELFVTEDGFREVITVIKPTFPLEKFIGKTSGTLPSAYKASPQTAVDANGDVFEITADTKAFGDWLDGAVYPVVIDPDFDIVGANLNYLAAGTNSDYATARSTGTNYQINNSRNSLGQNYANPNYTVYRVFMCYDTSSIGETSTVTQVNLNAWIYEDFSTTDFDVQIVKYDYSQWRTKYYNTTYREIAYDGCLTADADDNILCNSSSGTGKKTSGNLDTSWINKSGYTSYAFRSSRDYSNTQPSGAEYVTISNSITNQRSYLTVTYTAGSTGALRRTNMNAQMSNLTGGMHG